MIDQSVVYRIMAGIYGKLDFEYGERHISSFYDDPYWVKNLLDQSMQKYFEALWEDLLVEEVPEFLSNMLYLGSNRAVAQRLYSFDKQDSELNQNLMTYLKLKKEFETESKDWKEKAIDYAKFHEKKNKEELRKYKSEINELFVDINTYASTWLRKFEICDSVVIESVDAFGVQIGCSVALEKNGKKHSIADEGYGCVQILSVLVVIQNAILHGTIEAMRKGKLVPIVLAMEEPENHLHPKLQSLLADMLLEASKEYDIHFIVETHSEYLIRKSQVLVKKWYEENKDADKTCPFQAYYIPQNGTPYSLGYRKDGKFSESFGPGFYDESANLTFEIM